MDRPHFLELLFRPFGRVLSGLLIIPKTIEFELNLCIALELGEVNPYQSQVHGPKGDAEARVRLMERVG